MWTLLFDIDGTLLHTGGAGMSAIRQAFEEIFGVQDVRRVPVHGRTDYGIISEMFSQFDIDPDENMERFNQTYWELLPGALAEIEGTVLPGVKSLLTALESRHDVALGLLTGNSEPAAKIKLRHYGLESYFSFGGFGEWHLDRNVVAGLAFDAAREFVGGSFSENRVWVIGDTVHDIRCARAIDSQVLVVETGGVDPRELDSAGPDLQVENLNEADVFLERLNPLSI